MRSCLVSQLISQLANYLFSQLTSYLDGQIVKSTAKLGIHAAKYLMSNLVVCLLDSQLVNK